MKLPILVTLDRGYLEPLKVMVYSLRQAHPSYKIDLYVMQQDFSVDDCARFERFAKRLKVQVHWVSVPEASLEAAPTLLHYTRAMYYRLLAHSVLPKHLSKILYLDPDILVINDLGELVAMDLTHAWFAAAYHDIAPKTINQLRLYPYPIEQYYNSGVLLMNLKAQRQHLKLKELFAFVEANKGRLVMPDQDILNALYADKIVAIDEHRYNYDARYYTYYLLKSGGEWNIQNVMAKTSILHFCGQRKPWQVSYRGKFHALYLHMQKQTLHLAALND